MPEVLLVIECNVRPRAGHGGAQVSSTAGGNDDLDGRAAERDGPARRAAELVRQLPPPDREIFMLVHWEDFTLSQVAQLMSLPAGTARSRYSRARSRLRQALSTPEEP